MTLSLGTNAATEAVYFGAGHFRPLLNSLPGESVYHYQFVGFMQVGWSQQHIL
jgi:hypothetical protein